MPIWINAVGIGCIGVVCGYLIFYSYKRQHPPMSQQPLANAASTIDAFPAARP